MPTTALFSIAATSPLLATTTDVEINNPVRRSEEKLGPLEEMPDRGDALRHESPNLFPPDSEFVTYHAVVSTSPESDRDLARRPEARVDSRTAATTTNTAWARRRFRTSSAYLSASYAVKRDNWKDVKLEVYYLPAHTYDLDKMIGSAKAGLDYYTKNYGPYQFDQFRVIEFPRYRDFAQSFPNTVPYSEDIGFIGRLEQPGRHRLHLVCHGA